jgi:hypothetical protein
VLRAQLLRIRQGDAVDSSDSNFHLRGDSLPANALRPLRTNLLRVKDSSRSSEPLALRAPIPRSCLHSPHNERPLERGSGGRTVGQLAVCAAYTSTSKDCFTVWVLQKFVARAEVSPENSDTVSTRVRELSLRGCFLEFPTSLPAGTRVLVKIIAESGFFEAKGTVIYSQPNVGFGLAFLEVKSHVLRVLQKWLLLAKKNCESQSS